MIVGTAVPTIIVGTIVPAIIAGTKVFLAVVPTTLVGTAVTTIIVETTVPTMIAGTKISSMVFVGPVVPTNVVGTIHIINSLNICQFNFKAHSAVRNIGVPTCHLTLPGLVSNMISPPK